MGEYNKDYEVTKSCRILPTSHNPDVIWTNLFFDHTQNVYLYWINYGHKYENCA